MRIPAILMLLLPGIAVAESHSTFYFIVTDANGDVVFEADHEGSRPSVRYADPDLWQVGANLGEMRVQGFRMGEDSFAATEEIVVNNTFAQIQVPISGVNQRVSCDPDRDDPKGDIIRDFLDDARVRGRFNVTLVSCSAYLTDEDVDLPNLPYTLRGEIDLSRE